MKIVKLKKDVNFDVLKEYGFAYNKELNIYERELKWTLKNACHQLVIEEYSREVYLKIMETNNINEDFIGTNSHLTNSTLILISQYLEVVEDINKTEYGKEE